MRDKRPASINSRKQNQPVSKNDNAQRLPLTRFSEKISKKASRKNQNFHAGKIDRAIANSIREKGLTRMLTRVPRKEE